MAWASCLSAQQEAAADPGFWAEHGDKVLVAVVTAVLVLLVQRPVKALLDRAGRWLGDRLGGLGFRFRKRYLEALADRHRWLRLIGIYSRSDVHPPRLREVYISLRLAAAGASEASETSETSEDSERLSWSEAFGADDRRIVILGAPGAGKTTLLDYLVLVFTGRVRHPLRERLGSPFPLFARLREVVDEIERLAADYPGNRFVVTCRIAGWRNQLPEFHSYAIQELQDEDVRRFAGAWYREVLRTRDVNLLGAGPEPAEVQRVEAEASSWTTSWTTGCSTGSARSAGGR